MTQKIGRPSPAMVVACLALFVGLGSGAYAAKVKLKANQVKAKNIARGAVTGSKIGSGAVSMGKIANSAVTAAQLANNAVTSPKITDLSVNNAKIGLDAVAAGKLADNAVISAKMADNAVTETKIAAGAVTKAKFAASGVATNTTVLNLNNSCTVATFTATGVQAGDVIAFSVRDVPGPVGSLVVAQPAENTAQASALSVQLCEVNGIATGAIPVGDLQLDFVAIR